AIFHNQLTANTHEHLQALAKEIGPILASYSSDILLDADIFNRIKTVYDFEKSQGQNSKLTQEQKELLEKNYSSFTRNGALLDSTKKNELRAIDEEQSKLSPQFAENVLKATNEFQMLVTKKEELDGLPESAIEAAKIAAEEKGHATGWLITLHAPSYIPYMQHCKNREGREKLFRAFGSRALGGSFDNKNNILKILELREKRAQLLGYKNHASFVLEKRMAEKPEKVLKFLEKIKVASINAAYTDVKKVQEYAVSQGGLQELMPWDFAYWSERLKEHLFQFSDEDLRPYFKLENVIAGVFEHARKLYGLKFTESSDYPRYHDDVKTYEVHDEKTNEYIGLFYADFFPRETKSGGAWMTNYFEQGYFKNSVHRPHVAIVCNFTKPTKDKPALITFNEVRTLFHEFGHSLHSLLSKCNYRSLSGTNVYWDFVELPSQIMENWTLEKEGLDLFARHYKTNEKIPSELTQKIKDSSHFLAGYASLRQVTFALLDMAYHTTDFRKIQDPVEFENSITDQLRVLPKVDGTNFSCAFTHVFAGGYSAAYYSYKWAEVLDADAFELFKENGIFDVDTATKFKENILSRGGTEHPMELYKKFRGREPDPDALLRRDGLI
ncbi:MAG: M3 family metallopeptidase, partial [Bdellovibrionales bacterium]|nr:M3 family metallopeptidase [Bdellovibrionales bacterium]